MSNECFKVEAPGCDPLLFRRFISKTTDRLLESAIFNQMATMDLAPRCLYQDKETRIESFFEGRPLTIWELRNPKLSEMIMQKVCDFHHACRDTAQQIRPLNRERLALDVAIQDWGTAAKTKL